MQEDMTQMYSCAIVGHPIRLSALQVGHPKEEKSRDIKPRKIDASSRIQRRRFPQPEYSGFFSFSFPFLFSSLQLQLRYFHLLPDFSVRNSIPTLEILYLIDNRFCVDLVKY